MNLDKRKMGVLAAAAITVAGLALVIHGARRRAAHTKLDDVRDTMVAVAQGIARCSTARGYVPGLSEEAFLCGGFSPDSSRHVRYRWVKESDAAGFVVAEADLDGDGTIETRIELDVACGASGCQAATEFRDTDPQ